MSLNIKKRGFIQAYAGAHASWVSHMMAPAPVLLDDETIRVYVGGWSAEKVSRIFWVDVSRKDPTKVLRRSEEPCLEIGRDGCFDENGVFPAHVYRHEDGRIFLYYTGFQLGHKIRHYNFGGLAVSRDGGSLFLRHSEAPVMDRADEGLFVRAGQSIEKSRTNGFHVAYSAGSGWHYCAGELRPVYDVFYQRSEDGIALQNRGRRIVSCDLQVEHGLGRPQVVRLGKDLYVFYTRRIIEGMRYFLGCARSRDEGDTWERLDSMFQHISFGDPGEFDHEMIYFPAVVAVDKSRAFLFYSGNGFGRDGMGVLEVQFDHSGV